MATAEPYVSRESRDIAPQLTAIAARAVSMTAANGAAIAVRQGDQVVTVASCGDCVPDVGVPVRPSSFAGRCIVEESLLICNDTERDVRVDAAACRPLNVRSMIAAPITADGTTLGVLAVFASAPGAFLDGRVGLVRTLAAIAGDLLMPDDGAVPAERAVESHLPLTQPDTQAESRQAVPESSAEQAVPAEPDPLPAPRIWEADLDVEPARDVVRILPALDTIELEPVAEPEAAPESSATVSTAPTPPAPISEKPEEEPAAEKEEEIKVAADARHPDSWLSPEDINSQLQLENAPQDDRDLMLFPSLSRLEDEPRRGILKPVLIVLLLVLIAAAAWFFRAKLSWVLQSHKTAPPVATPAPAPQPIVHQQAAPPVTPSDTAAELPVTEEKATEPAAKALKSEGSKSEPAATSKSTRDAKASVPVKKTAPAAAPAKKPTASAMTTQLRPPQLLRKVEPIYPAGLKSTGTVVLNATIQKNGTVGKVTVVSGDPSLRDAAVGAVKQWEYRPAAMNGQPIQSTVDVEVSFKVAH